MFANFFYELLSGFESFFFAGCCFEASRQLSEGATEVDFPRVDRAKHQPVYGMLKV